MIRVIFNQKGGVGKTSISCNIAASFAKIGRRTLVIDLDSQANATSYLMGTRSAEVSQTIADYFESTLSSFKIFNDDIGALIHQTSHENLWIIPSHAELAELQTKLESRYKVFKLDQALKALLNSQDSKFKFDEVIIDTPPAMNFYTMSALIAADRVLVPFDCDAFSASAIDQVMEVVREVISDHKPQLVVEGIIINHFQAQAKLPLEAIAALRAKGYPILEPYLSTSIVMRESHAARIPLPFLRPAHKLSAEFLALAKNLSPGLNAVKPKRAKDLEFQQ